MGLKRSKYQEAGKYYVMKSFMTGIPQQILFVGSNQVGCDGKEMWQVWRRKKRISSFASETSKSCLEDLVNLGE